MENTTIEKIKQQYGIIDEGTIVDVDDYELTVELTKTTE